MMKARRFLEALVTVVGTALAILPTAARPSGYFRVENRDGVWWFVDPAGSAVLSLGVDEVAYEPDHIQGTGPSLYLEAVKKIYPDRNTWGLGTLLRLRMWGFNTIGAWSDSELWARDIPYTIILDIAASSGGDWLHGKPVDVYDTRFERTARRMAGLACAPRVEDRSLIGYFSDNELRWGPDWRGKESILQMYLEFNPSAAGRRQAVEFLRRRYADDIGKLNRAWETETSDFDHVPTSASADAYKADAEQFLQEMAAHYFEICARAIHNADPNHLYLGARFAGRAPDPVLRAARAADVVSVNIYSLDPQPLVEYIYQMTGKPILITEFAFRAQDSGLPNTKGAGPKVPDQQARAKAYREYVTRLESLPEAVGFHWFKWADEPKDGRFDGENSNYGLVDIGDRPYEGFVEAVRAANDAALEAHKISAH